MTKSAFSDLGILEHAEKNCQTDPMSVAGTRHHALQDQVDSHQKISTVVVRAHLCRDTAHKGIGLRIELRPAALASYEQAMFARSAQAAMEGEQLHRLLTGDNAAAKLVSMLTS